MVARAGMHWKPSITARRRTRAALRRSKKKLPVATYTRSGKTTDQLARDNIDLQKMIEKQKQLRVILNRDVMTLEELTPAAQNFIGDFHLDLNEADPQITPSVVRWLSNIKIDKPVIQLIEDIKAGVSFSYLQTMAATLDASQLRLGQSLNISKRTMRRRKTEGKFTAEESERIMRMYKIIQKALDVFDGDIDGARLWIKTPKKALGGEIPMDFADTDVGAQEVVHLLGRIEHGVFS